MSQDTTGRDLNVKEWTALLALYTLAIDPLMPDDDRVAIGLLYSMIETRVKRQRAPASFLHDAFALHVSQFNKITGTKTV